MKPLVVLVGVELGLEGHESILADDDSRATISVSHVRLRERRAPSPRNTAIWPRVAGEDGRLDVGAAARGDPLGSQLFDPVGIGRWTGHVGEDARANRRNVIGAVLGFQQEHRRMLTRYVRQRTVRVRRRIPR